VRGFTGAEIHGSAKALGKLVRANQLDDSTTKSRHYAQAKCDGKVAQNRANEIALRKIWLSVLGQLL